MKDEDYYLKRQEKQQRIYDALTREIPTRMIDAYTASDEPILEDDNLDGVLQAVAYVLTDMNLELKA